jgi:hypothetical protein
VLADADATFFIQRIAGPSERYRYGALADCTNADEYDCRILQLADGPAVTLITGGGPGEGVHNIPEADQVLDLDADGPPIAITLVEINNQAPKYRAQLWSFIPVAQLPLEDGSYQIVNSQTGLVLDLTGDNVNDPGTYTFNIVLYAPTTTDFFPSMTSSRPAITTRSRPEGKTMSLRPLAHRADALAVDCREGSEQ